MNDDTVAVRSEMTLVGHLVELRMRLLWCVLVLFAAVLGLLPFAAQLHTWLVIPLQNALPAGAQMIATGTIAPFLAPFKLAVYVALFITLPFMLYQLWAFIAPGLYRNEKHVYGSVLLASIVLFYVGMAFVYFVVLPTLFHFMAGVQLPGVVYMPDISDNINVVFKLFFAFGVAFEVPVITFVLIRAGVVSLEKMTALRRYIVVLCFAVAAVMTPHDVLSQLLMAVPMWILFEAGLLCARLAGAGKSHSDESGEHREAAK